MSTLTSLLVIALAGAVVSCKSQDAKDAEAQAEPAAQAWLALVDGEQYAASWDQSAALFQSHVASPAWQAQVGAVRKPLGKVLSRTLASKTYATSLPGAPDGKYVVITYTTSFENKASSTETITPMLDPDGAWRVSGYYIK